MVDWIKVAKEIGFDTAKAFDPAILVAREDVRAMCAENKCNAYNNNWTCPPECGTLEECSERMHSYQHGILLQTVGHLTKTIDSKGYAKAGLDHMTHLRALADEIHKELPDALCLGAGGCRICEKCAHPDPCRFPDKAMSSMEGYGLFITQVCRDCDVQYYYGAKTITYTACVLY